MAKKLGAYFDLIPYKNWSITLLIINIVATIVVFALRSILPPELPLFYGKPYGAEQLAPQNMLALPTIAALIICLVNTTINYFLKDEFLKKVLVGGMVAVTLLGLITVFKIIFLVGNI